MNSETKLAVLEAELALIESRIVLDKCGITATKRYQPAKPAGRAAKPPAKKAASTPPSGGISIGSALVRGRWQYSYTTAAGKTVALPENRAAWPAEIRELHERFEAIERRVDAARTRGGMLIGMGGPARLT